MQEENVAKATALGARVPQAELFSPFFEEMTCRQNCFTQRPVIEYAINTGNRKRIITGGRKL